MDPTKRMMMSNSGPYSETSSGDMYLDNRYLYTRNSKAIGVLWAVFSLCFAIINMVVFVQPQWLGDTATSRGTGYFGLWRSCRLLQDGQDLICEGRLDDFSTIQTPAFRAATVFVGLSVFLSSLCVFSMILFFFLHSSTVFHICGWIQLSCAMSMLVGVLIFPIGWDTPIVREVCGNDSDSYALGQCGIRWAFILALIGVVDSIVLSILAFVLGTRYVKLLPDHYLPNGTKYKGEINSAFMHPEYLPNKKLINNLQQNPLSAPNGTAGIIGGMKPSGTGSISPPGYLNGFGIESINGHPLPGNNQNGGNHHHHPHHSNLNEMERFSEYSHRTNRSSYKSSLIMGNNSSNHINTNLNVNLNPMQQPKSTKQSSSSSSSTSSSSALSFAASNSNKLPPPPPPPKSIQYQQRGKSSSSATTTTTAATPLSSSSSSSSAATTSSGKLSTPSVSASIHASSSSTSSIHHTFDNF